MAVYSCVPVRSGINDCRTERIADFGIRAGERIVQANPEGDVVRNAKNWS